MPIYDTPTPVDVAINLQVGLIEVFAADRADTIVTVSATNPGKAVDRRGAEETKVDFDGKRVTIVGPRPRISWFGPTESVDVRVELPTGSRLTAEVAVGSVRTVGRLGATRIKSSTGAVDVDTTGDLWLRASHGNATVGTAEGGDRDHRRPRSDPDRHGHRRRRPQGVARLDPGRASPAVTSRRSSPTATSRSRGRSPRSRPRPRTAASSCERSRPASCRWRAASASSPSACGPASPPGSTCPRRTGTCATSSPATALPARPSRPSQSVRALSRRHQHPACPMTSGAPTEGDERRWPPRRSQSTDCGSPTATRSCSTASTSPLRAGTVIALLGPNGAGKTTTVHILSTLLRPDAGPPRSPDMTSCATRRRARRDRPHRPVLRRRRPAHRARRTCC